MRNGMRLALVASVAGVAMMGTAANAAGFINGGFEAGSATGWNDVSSRSRSSVLNNSLTPDYVKANENGGQRSGIVAAGTADPNLGAKLGSTVYSGSYSYRVEDTFSGGYASVLEQQVNNYTDANIFFAWKAVLEAAHGANDAATMIITLKDLTNGDELIRRQYNAASGQSGVDPRFTYDNQTGFFYTKDWQIEQLAIDSTRQGHNFLLSVLAADCQPTAHAGYVYLDGFGAVTPPPIDPGPGSAVPEPSTWAMLIAGFGLAGTAIRRRRGQAALAAA